MLDIATADGLNTDFYTPPLNMNVKNMSEMIHSESQPIFGVSDGGAHTKFFTGGRYPSEALIKFVRENDVMSLEEAHFRLSAQPAMCAGFKNRGTLVEGAAADVVVYDFDNLKISRWKSCTISRVANGAGCSVPRATRPLWLTARRSSKTTRRPADTPGRLLRHGG